MAYDDEILSLLRDLNKKNDRQSEEIANVRVSQAKMEATFDQHMKQDEQMKCDLEKYNDHLENNTEQLKVHIAGVQELKRANDLSQKTQESVTQEINARITKLEAPRKFIHSFTKYVSDFSKFLIALATIVYIIHCWAKGTGVDLSNFLW